MPSWFYRFKIRILLATQPVVFFDALNKLNWYQKTLQKWVTTNNFSKNSKILEIGCATGGLSRYISDLNNDLTGIDLSENMINVAKMNNPDIFFQVSDVNQLPFNDHSFDAVISASFEYCFKSRKSFTPIGQQAPA